MLCSLFLQKLDSREVAITQDKFFADGVSEGMEFEITITVCNCSDQIILKQIVLGLEPGVYHTVTPLSAYNCRSQVKKI